MAMGIYSSSLGQIDFHSIREGEFIKKLKANIPGIKPEDVEFKLLESTPYDEIFKLQIFCHTRLTENESVSYSGIMEIDKKEFYGFDYVVKDGVLYITLYKEKKKDVQHFGFGFKFETKYPKEPKMWC